MEGEISYAHEVFGAHVHKLIRSTWIAYRFLKSSVGVSIDEANISGNTL